MNEEHKTHSDLTEKEQAIKTLRHFIEEAIGRASGMSNAGQSYTGAETTLYVRTYDGTNLEVRIRAAGTDTTENWRRGFDPEFAAANPIKPSEEQEDWRRRMAARLKEDVTSIPWEILSKEQLEEAISEFRNGSDIFWELMQRREAEEAAREPSEQEKWRAHLLEELGKQFSDLPFIPFEQFTTEQLEDVVEQLCEGGELYFEMKNHPRS